MSKEGVRENEGSKLGGVAAILIGVLNVVLVIYVIAATGDQRYDTATFLEYFAEKQGIDVKEFFKEVALDEKKEK